MSFYEDLVMQTQMNYSRYYSVYASGGTPYELSTNQDTQFVKLYPEGVLRQLSEKFK